MIIKKLKISNCIYCKKYGKDQYRCEVTGVIRNKPCKQYKKWYRSDWHITVPSCKHFKANIFRRFVDWFNEHFE